MIIEIRKAGFTNKGAEMMLLSIIQNLRAKYPEAILTMAPSTEKGSQPYSRLSSLGIKPKFKIRRGNIDISWLGNFIPRKIREAYGIVLNKEIDVIIDASGFSYSDQWGTYDTRELKDTLTVQKPTGQKFIMLPQAFGPFENKENIKNINKALQKTDLVFARDSHSFSTLNNVIKPLPSCIYQSPDFTCGLEKVLNEDVDSKKGMVAVVPNYRMLDKTDNDTGNYISALARSIEVVISNGLTPYFLIHETDLDKKVALDVVSRLGNIKIDMVEEDNPKIIKGYLSNASFVISSRYHASISALSQSVPVVGTSWSHKYHELFKEYEFSEGLCDIKDNKMIEDLITNLCEEKYRMEISTRLSKNAMLVKELNNKMWKSVFCVIDK